jgi:putative hydrolase of the HAD superfamily
MIKPRAVLFDYGDTVLKLGFSDWIAADKKLLEFAVNKTGITAGDLQDLANRINNEFEPKRIESMIEQDVITFYRLLFDTAGISLSISFEEAARISWDAAYRLVPEDGIHEVLDTLKKHGIKTGIISNSAFPGKILEKELEKHGLAGRFSFLIASADYGIRKPHPRIFDVAVRKMGLKPHEIWFAGDKIEFDIKGASNAGLFPIWYNRQNLFSDHPYDCLEIKNWYDFIKTIESL